MALLEGVELSVLDIKHQRPPPEDDQPGDWVFISFQRPISSSWHRDKSFLGNDGATNPSGLPSVDED